MLAALEHRNLSAVAHRIRVQKVVWQAIFGRELSLPLSMENFLTPNVAFQVLSLLAILRRHSGGKYPILAWFYIPSNRRSSTVAAKRSRVQTHRRHVQQAVLPGHSWTDLSSSASMLRHRRQHLLRTVNPAMVQSLEAPSEEVLVLLSSSVFLSSSSVAGESATSNQPTPRLEHLYQLP
jgi:hypothetical protein